MTRRVRVFACGFVLSGLSSLATGGCNGVEQCSSCDTPSRPTGAATYHLQTLEAFDQQGNALTLSTEMTEGTITVDVDAITIEYDRLGAHHVVTYALEAD